MSNGLRDLRWHILLSGLLLLVRLAGPVRASEVTVSGRITYEILDGLYVDIGADEGLRQGLIGSIRFDDGRVLEFEVLNATRTTALLRLSSPFTRGERFVGQAVELIFEQTAQYRDAVGEKRESSTVPSTSAGDEKFIPLLAPPEWTVGLPKTRNISHGQIRIRQMLQFDDQDDLDYSMTRLGSSGSLERIEGTRWSFEWSGDLIYRNGDAYRNHPDYQDPRVYLYLGSFHRSLGDGEFLRLGRFLPRELPGIGYVDAVQWQVRRTEHLYLGAIAGLKPDRGNLDPSVDEPLVAAYATLEAGDRAESHYLATAGLLGSLFEGKADRLALLVDQRAGLGPALSLYSTAEVNFDVGGADVRTGTRLTRLDTYAVSRISSSFTLRAGVDHWERADNRAERDLLVLEDPRLFDRGYWRYWIGGDHRLSRNWRLSEEVAFIDSPEYDYDPRWRVGLTHTGFFSRPGASATATVYNLDAQGLDGYGGRLSAYLPLLNRKLFVQPAAGFRKLDAAPQSQEFAVTYLSLRADGRLSSNWTLFGGFTHTYGDSVDATLLDLGLRYRW